MPQLDRDGKKNISASVESSNQLKYRPYRDDSVVKSYSLS